VLDWELSTLDLVPVAVGVTAWPGFPAAAGFAERYAAASGRPLRDLDFYLALGTMKVAVILEGVHARYLSGQSAGPGYDTAGAAVPVLVARGLRQLIATTTTLPWDYIGVRDNDRSRLTQAKEVSAPAGAWRKADDEELTAILATARDLFYELGFHGTTVRDIAGRVGVTVPALYYHHSNKEGILAALLDRSITSVTERCEQALSEAGDDPADRFRNLIECLALYMANHRKSAAMDAEIRALSPAARKQYSTQRRHVEQMLADTITAGVAAVEFEVTSPPDTARALIGMIQAITTWFSPGGGRLTAPELAARYVDIAGQTVGLRRD
jgi:AcrR family transcriptional regulator